MDVTFVGSVIEWRGPSPYWFVALPEAASDDVREVARAATYGWGVVPVEARIGDAVFRTSLFPKDGGYLLPLRDAVRRQVGVGAGGDVTVVLRVLVS